MTGLPCRAVGEARRSDRPDAISCSRRVVGRRQTAIRGSGPSSDTKPTNEALAEPWERDRRHTAALPPRVQESSQSLRGHLRGPLALVRVQCAQRMTRGRELGVTRAGRRRCEQQAQKSAVRAGAWADACARTQRRTEMRANLRTSVGMPDSERRSSRSVKERENRLMNERLEARRENRRGAIRGF